MRKIKLMYKNPVFTTLLLSSVILLLFGSPAMPGKSAEGTLITSGSVSTSVTDDEFPYHVLATATLYYSVYYLGNYEWKVHLTFHGYEREQGETIANAFWGVGSKKMSPSTCEYRYPTWMVTPDGCSFNGDGQANSRVKGGSNNQVIRAMASTVPYSSSTRDITLTTSPQGGGGGGCPYAAGWNGQEYYAENNLMPTAGSYWPEGGTNVQDYYQFINPLAIDENNQYRMRIVEFENEQSFLDQIELWTVDHSQSTQVAVDLKGNIYTYSDPSPPLQARDSENKNVQELIKDPYDGKIFEGQSGDTLTLFFPLITEEQAKLVAYADDSQKMSIHVQILDSGGEWLTVEELHPREANFNWEIADLTPYITVGTSLTVRLLWTDTHLLDFVGLDTSMQEEIQITECMLTHAIHSFNSDVLGHVLVSDGIYAEIVPGEHITFFFDAPTSEAGMARDWILFVDGYYIPYEP